MRYISVLSSLLLILIGCTPQSQLSNIESKVEPEIDAGFLEFCMTHKCRKNLRVSLKKEDGSVFKMEMKLAQPIVQGGMVSIFPGETIYLSFDPGKKGPENLKSVSTPDHSENTITFKFSQEDNLANGCGMMLYVHNPTKRYIKYDLGIQPIDSEDFYRTSSCPLMPELSGYESWSHPIFQLVMKKFRWVDQSNLDCN